MPNDEGKLPNDFLITDMETEVRGLVQRRTVNFTAVRCTIFEAVRKNFIERPPVIVLLINDVAGIFVGLLA